VVHMPQFNGKQGGVASHGTPSLRCPRNGQRTNRFDSPFSTQPLGALNKRLGRR
jgi:hypothetical protein